MPLKKERRVAANPVVRLWWFPLVYRLVMAGLNGDTGIN